MRGLAIGLMAMTALAGCGDEHHSSRELGRTEQALSTGLVISAIWGGGTGSHYKNDWVEIFNRGPTPVSLTGMTIQYSRSDYRTWDVTVNKIALTGTIPAGGYYLVSLAANTSGVNDLPTPDKTGSIVVATGGALFALVSDSTTLDCGPPPPVDGGRDPDAMAMATPCTSSSIIDFVGYGKSGASPAAAPVYEGTSAAPTGVATSVIRRKGAGCVETDDNGNDFELVAIATGPAPRNSASALNDCGRSDAGSDADIDADLDAALVDTGVVDTGAADTGAADTGAADTGAVDTGAADTGVLDTGVLDTGVLDSGSADTGGGADTSMPDTTIEDTGEAMDTSTPADTSVADTGQPVVDTGTAPTDEVLEDDGCGCRVPGASESRNTASALGIVVLGALAALTRRRR